MRFPGKNKHAIICLILLLAVQFAILACGSKNKKMSFDPSPAKQALGQLTPAAINQDLIKEFFSEQFHVLPRLRFDNLHMSLGPGDYEGFSALPVFPYLDGDSIAPHKLVKGRVSPQELINGILSAAASEYSTNAENDNCLVVISQTDKNEVDYLYEARKGCVESGTGCTYTGKVRGKGIFDLIEGKVDYQVSIEGYGMSCPERQNSAYGNNESEPASFRCQSH